MGRVPLPTVPTPVGIPLPTVTVPTMGRMTLPTVPTPGGIPLPTVTVPTPGGIPVPTFTVPTPGGIPVPTFTVPTPGRVTLPPIPTPGRVTLPTVPTPGGMTLPTVPTPGGVTLPTVPTPGGVTLPTVPTQVEVPLQQPVQAVDLGVQTPDAIALLQDHYPDHMTNPQNPNQVHIINRWRYVDRYLNNDDIGVAISPHKIIRNRNRRDIRLNRDAHSLRFNLENGRSRIKLDGNWILTPLNNFPDGSNGGVIARLPYQLFPRIRIGRNWIIQVDDPNQVTYPTPVEIGPDGYIIQDDPVASEFQFNASDYNSAFFQASIETSRLLHPSLEIMIQAAEAINVFPELRNRNQYSSYLRDATFFEVNRIYKGPRAEAARKFMLFMDQAQIPEEEIWSHYKYDLEPFTEDQITALREFMRQRGYEWTYLGFVNINHPAGRARLDETPLTLENFQASITPDQAILMEAWRTKALRDGVSLSHNLDLLGFRRIARDTAYYDSPILKNVGFNRNRIQRLRLRVNDIRNPEEAPINRNGRDIGDKLLSANRERSKSYYMMLFNEAMRRNLPMPRGVLG
jgi:hypothetical protein